VIFIYFRLFFIPINLHWLYNIPSELSIWKNFTWLAIVGHIAILTTAISVLKQKPLLTFAIIAIYLALALESSVFPIYHLAFEHRTYFPYIFIIVGAFSLLAPLKKSILKKIEIMLYVLIIIFSFLNISQNKKINTFFKWVDVQLSYNSIDHNFNSYMLEYSYLSNFENEGLYLSRKFKLMYPKIIFYKMFEEVFVFKNSTRTRKIEILEFISNQLILKAKIDYRPMSCALLNNFVIKNLDLVKDEGRKAVLTEALLGPQLDKFVNDTNQFSTLIKVYADSAVYILYTLDYKLKNHQILTTDETKILNNVKTNLKKYFNKKIE
jgi:hypothetical protein